MARSREGGDETERRAALATARIWPMWARSLGAMIEAEVMVRFACDACKRVYDVDLRAIAVLRGREWSLIGRTARCKASKCRKRGLFVAATDADSAFIALGQAMPDWLVGARPRDHEPPEDVPPPRPGAPPGVDAVRWTYANESERKRMVREAQG